MAPRSRSPFVRFRDGWNRFWFAPSHTQTLSIVRILLGVTLLMRQTRMYGLHRIDRFSAHIPRYEYDAAKMPDPDFALPWPLFEWVPPPSLWLYNRIDELLLVLALLFTLGLFTRVVTPIIAFLFAYTLFASQVNYFHHYWLFTIAFTVLAFSHSGDRFSLDSYLRGPNAERPMRSILPVRILQFVISAMYFFTCIAKLNHGWFTGDIMRVFDEHNSIRGPFAELTKATIGYQGLSVFTLFVEGYLAFALWTPRLARSAIAAGVILHIGIDMLMAVRTFSFQMMALYLVFIRPETGSTVVLFDGHCGMCQASRRIANLVDWLRRTTWLDFRDKGVAAMTPTVDSMRLEDEMAVITQDGRLHWGFAAWRELLIRFPLTFFPALALFVPGISHLGDRTYKFVARRRLLFSRCTPDGVCAVTGAESKSARPQTWRDTISRIPGPSLHSRDVRTANSPIR